jgi:FAD/FMN-containing dehydrogenase
MAQLMADNEAVYGRIRTTGGERYLPDTPPDTAAFWRTHFGEKWDALCQARKRWDPDGIFGSSFGNFT